MHIDDTLNMQQQAAVKIKTRHTHKRVISSTGLCATCSSLFREKLQVKKLVSVKLKDTFCLTLIIWPEGVAEPIRRKSNQKTLKTPLDF